MHPEWQSSEYGIVNIFWPVCGCDDYDRTAGLQKTIPESHELCFHKCRCLNVNDDLHKSIGLAGFYFMVDSIATTQDSVNL
jgi:hypothetical protein